MEPAPGMQGRSFQDMSEEERTKMREEMTKRREEQQKVMAAIQQQMDTLKGARQLMTEHQQAMTPLKDLLASAQKENAKATAGMIEKLIAERQKQFDGKMAAMGITPEQLERMMQGGGQRRQQ
jgi:septal ring factor EnvC (AmiA/AmiB activator)